MTIVVVAIVAIPLSLLLSQHIRSAFQSENLTVAHQLARFEMEYINNLAYASITSATFSNYQGYDYDVSRTVSYAYGDAASAESVKQVTIEVTRSGSSEVLVDLTTYIAKNLTYGL